MESFVAGMGVGLIVHVSTLHMLNWPYTASNLFLKLEPLGGVKSMFKFGLAFTTFVNLN